MVLKAKIYNMAAAEYVWVTLPCDTTAILSAFLIVDKRWAITTHVLPSLARSSASCTIFSLSEK